MPTATPSTPDLAHLTFRGAAAEIIRSREGEVVIVGPAGTGKSLAYLYKLHRAALKYPGMRGLIVRKTRESLTQAALVTFEEKVLSPGWRRRLAANCQRRVRQSYRYPNGSELVVGGIDKPGKIMSTEYDMIYAQELIELDEGAMESLTTRLRNGVMPYQQFGGDTNPDAPTHWLKLRGDAGRTTLLESRHEDNPALWDADSGDWTEYGRTYLERLERLTGARYLRLRKGQWAGVEGMVYDAWDRAVHLIDTFPIPADWRRIRSIDFGYTNPFVCQWWAIDPDGRMHLYRELYGTNRLVSDWADLIRHHTGDEKIEATVADHDAEDRATLHAAKVFTMPAYKARLEGIEAVQKRMRRAGDGKPRIYIHKGCRIGRDPRLVEARKPTATVEEIDRYAWTPAQPGRSAKEEPSPVDDHGMDGMRYAAAYIDRLGRRVFKVDMD